MSRPVLTAEDLHTFYGKSHILHGVSLEVREGEIVTLLGRNGAGKTTTLRSLVGLTPPRNGVVLGTSGTLAAARIAKNACRNALDSGVFSNSTNTDPSVFIPSSKGLSTAASIASMHLSGAG